MNTHAFHAPVMPIETVSDALRFLKVAAGQKHDLTGVVVAAGDLRALAAVLRGCVLGNAKLPETEP